MNIEKELAAWDNKSADEIKAIFVSHSGEPNFAEKLVSLITKESIQPGATWLLKALLESGTELTTDQIHYVYSSLSSLDHWESKLHVLQSIPYMPINAAQADDLHKFLRATIADPNKFVRAWAYNGLFHLASQHPEYIEEAKQFFDLAMIEEAASVKARVRKVMKKGF